MGSRVVVGAWVVVGVGGVVLVVVVVVVVSGGSGAGVMTETAVPAVVEPASSDPEAQAARARMMRSGADRLIIRQWYVTSLQWVGRGRPGKLSVISVFGAAECWVERAELTGCTVRDGGAR